MPLDKAAFESLRLDHGSEPQRYQDSPARQIAIVSSKVALRWWDPTLAVTAVARRFVSHFALDCRRVAP